MQQQSLLFKDIRVGFGFIFSNEHFTIVSITFDLIVGLN